MKMRLTAWLLQGPKIHKVSCRYYASATTMLEIFAGFWRSCRVFVYMYAEGFADATFGPGQLSGYGYSEALVTGCWSVDWDSRFARLKCWAHLPSSVARPLGCWRRIILLSYCVYTLYLAGHLDVKLCMSWVTYCTCRLRHHNIHVHTPTRHWQHCTVGFRAGRDSWSNCSQLSPGSCSWTSLFYVGQNVFILVRASNLLNHTDSDSLTYSVLGRVFCMMAAFWCRSRSL